MPIGRVWIYRLLFVCLFVCACSVTDFSAQDKTSYAASNFARRFIDLQCRMSHTSVNFAKFAPPEAQNRTNRQARGPHPHACKH